MTPTLSIITINRNNAEGLRKTIESVVTQTQTDFEYLIIDGNSTDESVAAIKEFAEHPEYGKKITYWVSESDTGIYNAMNKGIRLAKGDYLHMLNSGDWYEPNALDHILPELQEEKPDVLFLATNIWQNDIKIQLEIVYPEKLNRGTVLHQGLIYHKKYHEKEGLYDERYKFAADYDFTVKCFYNKFVEKSFIYNPSVNFLNGGIGQFSLVSQKEFKAINILNGFAKKERLSLKKILKLFIPYGFLKLREKIKEK